MFETTGRFMNLSILAAFVFVFPSLGTVPSSNSLDNQIFTTGVPHARCAIRAFESEFRASTAVFVGKVVEEKKTGDKKTFEFEVDRFWKGNVGKRIKADVYETMRYQAWFKVGETYLIFAAADGDGQLFIGRCSRSKPIDEAGDDERKLGAAKRPK